MLVRIMRGIPGSGKSSWVNEAIARENKPAAVVSADSYFQVGGQYRFDPRTLPMAHDQCLRNYMLCLMDKTVGKITPPSEVVYVDNTNLYTWEISPYYRMAEIHDCQVEIVPVHCGFMKACTRNVHEVPHQKIWEMYQAFLSEKLPPWWKVKHVTGQD